MPWLVLKIVIALVAMLLLYWFGAALVRGFGAAPPEEGDVEIHPVDLRFECLVCGAQVTMTAAPGDEPVAPRHCMEEMRLVPPISEDPR